MSQVKILPVLTPCRWIKCEETLQCGNNSAENLGGGRGLTWFTLKRQLWSAEGLRKFRFTENRLESSILNLDHTSESPEQTWTWWWPRSHCTDPTDRSKCNWCRVWTELRDLLQAPQLMITRGQMEGCCFRGRSSCWVSRLVVDSLWSHGL